MERIVQNGNCLHIAPSHKIHVLTTAVKALKYNRHIKNTVYRTTKLSKSCVGD